MAFFHTGIAKSKRKKKPGWQQREAAYQKFLKDNDINFSVKKKKVFEVYVPKQNFHRETKNYPSFESSQSSPNYAQRPERKEYTGDYLVGIATMHKSNAVPVTRDDNPTDYSTMRRN